MKHVLQLLRALTVKPRNYPTSTKVCYCINQQRPLHILQSVPQPRYLSVATTQWKYNKKDVDSDSDNEDETEFKDERDSKVVKTKVNSLRADLLLKAGLGIARK